MNDDTIRSLHNKLDRILINQISIMSALAVMQFVSENAQAAKAETPEGMELDHTLCSISTGICGSITAGRGELCQDGYFDIPCEVCAAKAQAKYDEKKSKTTMFDEFTFGQMKEYLKAEGGRLVDVFKDTDLSAVDRIRRLHQYLVKNYS